MKLMRTLSILMATLLIATCVVMAEDTKEEAKKDAPAELKNQTLCPVMGGKIDSTVYTDIQGQRVYHCCPACSAPLKKDPDKFFKKAAAEGVLFENVQTACPVSGKELKEKAVFADFEGRRIYLCCEMCQAPFKKEPLKYLSKLDAPVEAKEVKVQTGHEGHGH
ncbi:MAG: hypothetical protein V3T31_06030 [candidate division Zixibacteria bacterium]